jgi:hypothetical protein
MSATDLIKALLINAAATNAAAVCENTSGGGVPIDPLIQDTNLQGKGVMVYEEAKIQYAALLRAFQDKTGIWPDPKVSDDQPPAPAGQAARGGPQATGAPTLASLLPGLVQVLNSLPAGTTLPASVGGATTVGALATLLQGLAGAAPAKPAPQATTTAPAAAPATAIPSP